jgi:hypothetical protein
VRVRRFVLLLTLLAPLASAQQPAAPPKQPLPNSPLAWEVREGNHPRLGPITVAVPAQSVVTPVGKEKILSLVFFSCERTAGRIAIELANAAESDAHSGLYPKQMPKLFCNPRSAAPRSELQVTWYVSEIGDAMARGLAPSELRRCASVEVHQDLALPRGWGPETQHIEIEVIPYKKELDTVLAACAAAQPQLRAQAPKVQAPPKAAAPIASPMPKVAATPASPPAPRVTAPPAPTAAEAPWRSARVLTTGGRTNVRANPGTSAPIVIALDPGAPVLVQPTGTEWWRAKAASGNGFSGYIRRDRLALP